MEVNKPEAAIALKRDGKQSTGYKSPHDQDGADDESQDRPGGHAERWPEEDAFMVDGGLSGPISPEVQDILNGLAAQIEPLRQELERTKARESEYYNMAQRHSYLPVLSRHGLETEFTKLIGHLESLGSATFVCVSVLNAEQIRHEYGRYVYEQAMTHVCGVLEQITRDDDRIGCLGGHDFGMLLLASGEKFIDELAEKLRQALNEQPFHCNGGSTVIAVSIGGKELSTTSTLAQSLENINIK